MFHDRRFPRLRDDINENLIKENAELKKNNEYLRLLLAEKDKQIKGFENWWYSTGIFLAEKNRALQQKVTEYERSIQSYKKEILLLSLQLCMERLKNIFKPEPKENAQNALPGMVNKTEVSSVQYQWLNILKPPFRCVIIGKAGSGKSALGHFLLETFHYQKKVFLFKFPQDKVKLLPNYIGVLTTLEKLPPDSICLIDESYLLYFSRNSMTGERNKSLLEMLGLFRQRNCSLIFITQNTGLMDKNIISLTDYIIVKELTKLQIEFERPEIKQLLQKVTERFAKISGNKEKYSYVITTKGDFEDLVENALPSYWSKELSNAYSSNFTFEEKPGMNITLEEKKNTAKRYRMNGYSYKQIARILGVSKATIINWVKHNK